MSDLDPQPRAEFDNDGGRGGVDYGLRPLPPAGRSSAADCRRLKWRLRW
jgi:hypothetical protein